MAGPVKTGRVTWHRAMRFTSCVCGADIELEHLVVGGRDPYWLWVCRSGPDVYACYAGDVAGVNHHPDWSDLEWLAWWLDEYEPVAA